MKILIIGKNSYIGNHIDEWLTRNGHKVEQLDVLTEEWKAYDYSPYDAIVHVAGIVHRPDCKDWNLYKSVNTDMPVAIATKAKKQGVRSYMFFSTMGVYGLGKQLKPVVIDMKTPLISESLYGKSKRLAEENLSKLQDDTFNVSFVRPPSVYGKGCRGGYITGFTTIVRKLPIIPSAYENVCQSFVYIDNLSECVRVIIENNLSSCLSGSIRAFCPQDDEIPSANRLLEVICKGIGKKYRASKFLGLCLRMVSFIPLVKKAYGGIEYARELSTIPGHNYQVVSFEEGIKRTVS
ncbi:MAG: NAD-dependent epimerase/dehydratase family protein [Paraprevotella sp.]|nr:NAD-dependent epimerase/dehydratase family protein [Paraprevotella sp.]